MEELKPCQLCGGNATAITLWEPDEYRSQAYNFAVVCSGCGIFIGWDDFKKEAAKIWNQDA